MPRPCSVCRSPRRAEVDAAILEQVSLRDIAGRFGTSKSALDRHRPHVSKALIRAAERKQEHREETLFEKVGRLEADARRLLESAEREQDIRAAVAAARQLLDVVKFLHELQPKAEGEEKGLDDLFARMSPAELESYAREGTLPDWFDQTAGAPRYLPPAKEQP